MMVRFYRRKSDEDAIVSILDEETTGVAHLTQADLRALVSAADHFISKRDDNQIREFHPNGQVEIYRGLPAE